MMEILFFRHGLHGKHGLKQVVKSIKPCNPCNPCLIIFIIFREYHNQFDIYVRFGFLTIPALHFCPITSKNKAYML